MSKAKIPRALREQLWLERVGKKFESKCKTAWCKNKMSVFDFQCGHDIPESKGGETNLQNLVPICSRCNLSMSNTYTFKEWNAISVKPGLWKNLETFVTKLFGTKGSGTKLKQKPTNQKSKPSQSHGKR
jgi:5-methylcytosine-specific restriction endonuclease McrA